MTTLNGLPRSWDSFIQEMCSRRKLISFKKVWEECTQEEAQLITREEKMGAIEDQDLTVHTRRNYRKQENHHHNKREGHCHKCQRKAKIDLSSIICYICDEKGHYSRDCPRNVGSFNKKSKKKMNITQVMRNMNSTSEDDGQTLIHLIIWIRRNAVVNEEVEHIVKDSSYSCKDIRIKGESTHQTNK